MYNGIYKRRKFLKDDQGDFINLNDVVCAVCKLEAVTHKYKYVHASMKSEYLNKIANIKSFFVSEYALIAKDAQTLNESRHPITKFLYKVKAIRKAGKDHRGCFRIQNGYENFIGLKNGACPRDLFHPIKTAINYLFFDDGYYIDQLIIEGAIDFLP